MYKILSTVAVALGLITPTSLYAKPAHKYHHVKKHHKYKRKPLKVAAEKNPFLRNKLLEHPLDIQVAEVSDKHCFILCFGVNDTSVIDEAKKWEGKTVKHNKQELKELFADNKVQPIDPARIPWCAAFANAILNRKGYNTTGSLAARSFLAWGIKTKDPEEGDIVVLSRGHGGWAGHVGFFMGYQWYDGIQYVKVFGGNTDHSVQVGYFPSGKVLGYRKAV